MPSFPIIDSHLHIWQPDLLDISWLKSAGKLNRSFLLDDYDQAKGALDVEAMVFVECDVNANAAIDEVQWVSEIAKQDSRIKAIVAHAPIHEGDAVRAHLEKLQDNSLMRGVRRLLQQEEDVEFALRPNFLAGLQALQDFDWSFDICITYRQMASTIQLVRKFPNMQFVLDHIGKPDIAGHQLEPWATQMKELARSENVVCKLSGVATEADHDCWVVEDLAPFILATVDAFGPQRLLYAGDWPVATNAVEYVRWVAVIDLILGNLSDAELRALYRENANKTYKLSL